jgi:hypothetical protein
MTLYLVNFEKNTCQEFRSQCIVADGSNVAFENVFNGQKAKYSNLILLGQFLETNNIIEFVVLCDKSLHYKIDEVEKYDKLIECDSRFHETPGGVQADHFILQHAFKSNGLIISNDNFRDFYAIYDKNWIINHRISFCIINDQLYLDKLIFK